MTSSPPPRPATGTVLLLSEDRVLCELLGDVLAHESVRSVHFDDFATVSDHIASNGPPAALLLDGIERHGFAKRTLSRLQDDWTFDDVTVLLLRGSVTPQDVVRHPRVDRFVLAPIHPEDLVRLIKRIVHGDSQAPEGGSQRSA